MTVWGVFIIIIIKDLSTLDVFTPELVLPTTVIQSLVLGMAGLTRHNIGHRSLWRSRSATRRTRPPPATNSSSRWARPRRVCWCGPSPEPRSKSRPCRASLGPLHRTCRCPPPKLHSSQTTLRNEEERKKENIVVHSTIVNINMFTLMIIVVGQPATLVYVKLQQQQQKWK